MKLGRLFILSSALILVFLSLSNCKKDEPINSTTNKPVTNTNLTALNLHINEFIWTGLHNYYLWVDNVPNLSLSKFPLESDWIAFLNKYQDHEKLFYDLLYKYKEVDKWSWIVDDYAALEQQFQGISKSIGYDFRLARIGTTNDVFGFVRYVVKGSPADRAGIKRGDIFIEVDGQQLTVSNYQALLFGSDTYTLSFATISNHTIIPSSRKVSLTAVEVHENPIYFDTILTINYTKYGYLVYNMFISDYDIQLNEVFNYYKEQNIKQLILDLRYNSGGSGNSATYLASMIYSTDTTKVFFKNQYNKELQAYLDNEYGTDYFITRFTDKIEKTVNTPETPINSLGLNKLYIITTDNTASASELVINGLMPYISVITIGTSTLGKYVGSITIKDYDSVGNVNPYHKWAMQPIIMKATNSAGVSDYINGFAPTDSIEEDIANLLPLGDINETLLKATIDYIKGNKKRKSYTSGSELQFIHIADSKDFIPHSKEMYFRRKF